MGGKATRRGLSANSLFLLFLLAFVGAVWAKVAMGSLLFFTQDSFSLMALADDLAYLRLPNLEQYAQGAPVNPWPLLYPILVVLLTFGGHWQYAWGIICLQVIALLATLWLCTRENKRLGWMVALATDSGLWALSHGWTEFFWISATLALAFTIDTAPKRAGWLALIGLHTRLAALPSYVCGYLFAGMPKQGRKVWLGAGASIVFYILANRIYTGSVAGGPRPFEAKFLTTIWWADLAKALLNESCFVRDGTSIFFVAAQIIGLLFLFWGAKVASAGQRFLIGSGIGYGIFTIGSHAVLEFAEPLDDRLLGPATVLIFAGLLQGARFSPRVLSVIAIGQLVLSLPFSAIGARIKAQTDQSKEPVPYGWHLPSWAPNAPPSPPQNPITQEGVALGEKLFFDTRLSPKGLSCASCHNPIFAFSEPLHRPGLRNTPSLLNVGWQTSLFADGGVKNLESVALAPLHSPKEMGSSLGHIVDFMWTDSAYKRGVQKAFSTDSVQSVHVLRALAQYMRTLVSKGSRVDAGKLIHEELLGQRAFLRACASCHNPPLYADSNFHYISKQHAAQFFPMENPENGRFRITGNLSDIGAFKTPSLRNVALTPPYFHSGLVPTLDRCLGHGTLTVNTLAHQENVAPNQMRRALVSFLEGLTDTTFQRKASL